MAAGPICIVTPEGIKCMSSPLRAYRHRRGCAALAARRLKDGLTEKDVKDFSRKLTNPGHQKVVEKSLLLMLQDDVKFSGAFTLVKTPDTR